MQTKIYVLGLCLRWADGAEHATYGNDKENEAIIIIRTNKRDLAIVCVERTRMGCNWWCDIILLVRYMLPSIL